MKRKIQALVVILLLSVLLPNAFSCANPSEELPDPGAPDIPANNNGDTPTPGEPSHKDPSESEPDSPTDTKPPQSDRLISADLNGDGTKDSISITLEETQRSNATIEITDGKDGTVLLSDTLAVGAPKIGAYYLKIGKAGNPNELVHWNYVLRDQRLHFSASTFSFGVDGKPAYRMSESKAFDLSPQAAVSSGNILFGVIIDEINENIQADCLSYSTYLLLSNQGENLSVSTESNLLSPSNLTFTLENFVDSEETNTPPETSGGTEQPGEQPGEDLPGETPEMAIGKEYTVVATQSLQISVTENKQKYNRTARLAALRNDKGENALYLDVLSADNQVMTSITWKGNYQLFLTDDGALLLYRIAVMPSTQRGTAVYQLFEISDVKLSGYNIIELDTPQINAVPGEGASLNFAVGTPMANAMYGLQFSNFMDEYHNALIVKSDAGSGICMIADCYLDPNTPSLYSDADRVAIPNLEDKAIADKYTWEYATGIFSK